MRPSPFAASKSTAQEYRRFLCRLHLVHAEAQRSPRRLHHRAGRRHPTGKLLEAIIESVDEFYSENLAQEGHAGDARGGVQRLLGHQLRPLRLQEGPRPGRAEEALNPPADAVVRRIFDMALQGKSILA